MARLAKARQTAVDELIILRRKLVLSIELRLLVSIVTAAIYFIFGFKMIDVSVRKLAFILGLVLLLALLEWLLLPVKRARKPMLYTHYVLDLVFVSGVIHLLSPDDRLYYTPLYLLVIAAATLIVSPRFGYVLAGLASLGLSLCYALLSLGSSGSCPYASPFGLLIINSSFFFILVGILQASLSLKNKS